MTLKTGLKKLEGAAGIADPEAMRRLLADLGMALDIPIPPGLTVKHLIESCQGTSLKPVQTHEP
jgi:hypothetical protein